VATADFDGDGASDVAAIALDSYTLEVLFGDGAGGVRSALSIRTGNTPIDLLARDFDGDGRLDVVTSDLGSMTLSFHRNDGAGGFEPPVASPLGESPARIDAADADGDGLLDVACSVGWDALVAYGNGDGTFTPAPLVGLPAFGEVIVPRLVDCDEDGVPDLVALATHFDPSSPFGARLPLDLLVARGTGAARGFVVSPGFQFDALAKTGLDLLVPDLDGDSHADLLVAASDRGAFALYGDGTGAFSPAERIDTGGRPASLVLADFDADREPDLAACHTVPGRSVGVLPATGNGRFGGAVTFETGPTPFSIAAGDFDGDRHADVVVASNETGVQILLNRTPELCRAGTVNAGAGEIADVLFANDSPGGVGRRILLTTFAPLTLFVAAPPLAAGPSPNAVGLWRAEPDGSTYPLPYGVGSTCLPLPLHGASPAPLALFNNTGKAVLGSATHPSSPAPHVLLSRPSGVGRRITFYAQGVIVDPGSAGSRPASVTNGLTVEVR
jgi:hypothetical protein